jgi:hypothetical protein
MLVIVGLFFFGGDNEPYNGQWNPKYTDVLLYWMYALLAITLVVILAFVLLQFVGNFKTDVKKALFMLGIVVSFVVLLFVTYSIGDGTPIPVLAKPDLEAYNTASWLKVTDMFLYSIYVMGSLTVLAILWGSVKKVLERK